MNEAFHGRLDSIQTDNRPKKFIKKTVEQQHKIIQLFNFKINKF